jgi:hypothetical protein
LITSLTTHDRTDSLRATWDISGMTAHGTALPPRPAAFAEEFVHSLADRPTRPVEHRCFGRAVERIRASLAG